MAAKYEQAPVHSKTTTIIFHQSDGNTQNRGCLDPKWLVMTLEGWLKLCQWFTTLFSFTIIVGKLPRIHHHFPEYNFMVFVSATTWAFVSVHILLRITQMFEKMPLFLTNPISRMILCLVGVLAFLIASSVVSVYSKSYHYLEASAAFGYITTLLFLLESFALLAQSRRHRPLVETPFQATTVEIVSSNEPERDQAAIGEEKEFRKYSE